MTRNSEDGQAVSRTPSNAHSHHSNSHHHHPHHTDSGGNAAAAHSKQNAAAAAVEYGYPHGHVGFLSAEEATAFAEFKAFLTEQGAYEPGPPPSHDDPTLLRFLRARKWVVADAYKQFKDTEDWRALNQLNVLYDTIDLEAYDQSRRLVGVPQAAGRLAGKDDRARG